MNSRFFADFKILAFQNPELNIFADFKIFALQNPDLKILARSPSNRPSISINFLSQPFPE